MEWSPQASTSRSAPPSTAHPKPLAQRLLGLLQSCPMTSATPLFSLKALSKQHPLAKGDRWLVGVKEGGGGGQTNK